MWQSDKTPAPPRGRGGEYADGRQRKEKSGLKATFSLSKKPRVDKGPQPLMFNPALTTCASERMKTQRFSYFADFAARERMREAKPVKLKKVAFSHFFDTLKAPGFPGALRFWHV